jgi:hypothetical protein
MDEIKNLFLSLNQGNIFNQKQNSHVFKGKSNNKGNNKLTEGFTDSSDSDTKYERKPVFINAYNRMKTNKTTSTDDVSELNNLQNQYNELSSQYKEVLKTVETEGLEYNDRMSKNNPYLNNNITINNSNGELQLASSGVGGYVTSKGIFKSYPDQTIFDSTAGKNGCPNASKIIKDVPKNKFSSLLINGTDMKSGQSCGAEGQNVYVSKMLDAPSVKYSGCFYNTDPNITDSTVSSMTKASDTDLYTMEECKQYAIDSGNQFFALQGIPDTNGKSTCLIANDLTTVQQYGNASKQTNKVQLWTTNGLIDRTDFNPTSVKLNNKGQLVFSDTNTNVERILNLSSNTNNPETDYYLSLQKTGKLCLYNSTPNGKDRDGGALWCSPTTSEKLTPNPEWVSSKGKYSDPFLSSSSNQILFQNEWISSGDGSLQLMMESNGNLVLYTSTISKGCEIKKNLETNSITNIYGINNNINATFEINNVGVSDNLGIMAYIDNNSVAHGYSSNMLSYPQGTDSKYNMYTNFDSPDDSSNIAGGGPMNTINDCQSACNLTDGCAGFVWVNAGEDANMCYLKNSNMFPKTPRIIKNNRTMGVRVPTINNVDMNNQGIQDIDTLRYQNYVKGDNVSPENADKIWKNTVISSSSKIQMDELQTKMNMINQQIDVKIKDLYVKDQVAFDTMNVNDENLKKKISSYKNTVNMGKKNGLQNMGQPLTTNKNGMYKEGMQNIDMSDVNGMLEDTDTRVLQENYSYIFWSILAAGLLIITVDVMKKGNNINK